jgi:hypothetical protein
MLQARTACEAWKKEAAMAKQKADMANKEKEAAILKVNSLQKEVSSIFSSVAGSDWIRIQQGPWNRICNPYPDPAGQNDPQ